MPGAANFPFSLPERYEATGERLAGGQGFVYVCTDKYLDRKVAIKVMRSVLDVGSLEKELRLLTSIRSPHVAEIYDVVRAKRSKAIGLVQEYVPGQTLEGYSRAQSPGSREFLEIAYQVACGLSDIHRFKIVHRDVKPENIKFGAEKVIKLLDFGISKIADPEGETSKVKGTRCFRAPELYKEPPVRFGPKADMA